MGDILICLLEIQLNNKNMMRNCWVTGSQLGQWHRLYDYVKKKAIFSLGRKYRSLINLVYLWLNTETKFKN
jgi:hypothetical protein